MLLSDYETVRSIGRGSYGDVLLAKHKRTGEHVAVKCIRPRKKSSSSPNPSLPATASSGKEVSVLRFLQHQNIVRLEGVVNQKTPDADDKDAVTQHLVMEYAGGGDLLRLLRFHNRFEETFCQFVFSQLVNAVSFAHSQGIVHRDIKLENILLTEHYVLKLADWGFATTYSKTAPIRTTCGSKHYLAPEVVLQRDHYGPESDVWALGVVLFAISCGTMPFYGRETRQLRRRITAAEYRFTADISPELRNLLSRMFVTSPCRRITLDQVRKHPWMLGITMEEDRRRRQSINYILTGEAPSAEISVPEITAAGETAASPAPSVLEHESSSVLSPPSSPEYTEAYDVAEQGDYASAMDVEAKQDAQPPCLFSRRQHHSCARTCKHVDAPLPNMQYA